MIAVSSRLVSIYKRRKKDHFMGNYSRNLIGKGLLCSKLLSGIEDHFIYMIGFSWLWKHHLWNILRKEIIMILVSIGLILLSILVGRLLLLGFLLLVGLFLKVLMIRKYQLVLDYKNKIWKFNCKLLKDTQEFITTSHKAA